MIWLILIIMIITIPHLSFPASILLWNAVTRSCSRFPVMYNIVMDLFTYAIKTYNVAKPQSMVITYLNTEISKILVATVVSEVLTTTKAKAEVRSQGMLHMVIGYLLCVSLDAY